MIDDTSVTLANTAAATISTTPNDPSHATTSHTALVSALTSSLLPAAEDTMRANYQPRSSPPARDVDAATPRPNKFPEEGSALASGAQLPILYDSSGSSSGMVALADAAELAQQHGTSLPPEPTGGESQTGSSFRVLRLGSASGNGHMGCCLTPTWRSSPHMDVERRSHWSGHPSDQIWGSP